MKLILAEKPFQAHDIAKAILRPSTFVRLDTCFKGYDKEGAPVVVAFAKGHLLEQQNPEEYDPKWEIWSFDRLPIFPVRFKLKERDAESKNLLYGIGKMTEVAEEIINACDAGREGELIFWEVMQWVDAPRRRPHFSRMWIQDPTPAGLMQAYVGRRPSTDVDLVRLRDVAFLRSQADWLFGFNMSRYVTLTAAPHPNFKTERLAIGRVITPLLGIINDRTEEVGNFQSKYFYTIYLTFLGSGGHFRAQVVSTDEERFGSKTTAFAHYEDANTRAYQLAYDCDREWLSIDNLSRSNVFPSGPFSLVELQRSCARLLNWSPAYTLKVAQSCYARDKCITYPRTESWHIPVSMRDDVAKLRLDLWERHILSRWPQTEKLPRTQMSDRYFKKDEEMEEHHAILPTWSAPMHNDPSTGKVRHEWLLWDLIVRRLILSLEPPAEIAKCERVLEVYDPKHPDHPIKASVKAEPLIAANWLLLEDIIEGTKGYAKNLASYNQERWVECDGKAELLKVDVVRGQTERPLEFTDDTLLAKMVDLNLGTAATRAESLEKLIAKNYIERTSSGFITTRALGTHLVSELRRLGAQDILSPEITANWEKAFDDIESGAVEYKGPDHFMEALKGRIIETASLLQSVANHRPTDHRVFCPSSFKPVEEQRDIFIFPGYAKIKTIKFLKIFCGRPMSALDWRNILTSSPRVGAGPYKFKGKSDFVAKVSFSPKKTKHGHFVMHFVEDAKEKAMAT